MRNCDLAVHLAVESDNHICVRSAVNQRVAGPVLFGHSDDKLRLVDSSCVRLSRATLTLRLHGSATRS